MNEPFSGQKIYKIDAMIMTSKETIAEIREIIRKNATTLNLIITPMEVTHKHTPPK